MYSERNYTLAIHAELETRANWQVSTDRDSDPRDPTFIFEIPKPRHGIPELRTRVHDAFDVRKDFLAIRTPEGALAFFRTYGPWQVKERYANAADPFTWKQVERGRGFFEDALTNRSTDRYSGDDILEELEQTWLWKDLALELPFQDPLVAIARCDDVRAALRASVYLSRLGGLKWSRCAKTDCNKLFQRKSKREQLYCCTEHANVQSTRNYKKRNRTVAAGAHVSSHPPNGKTSDSTKSPARKSK